VPEKRRKFDKEFRAGAVRIVLETGKPIVQVARDLGGNEGTLGNWVARDREAREGTAGLSTGDIVELKVAAARRHEGVTQARRRVHGARSARLARRHEQRAGAEVVRAAEELLS